MKKLAIAIIVSCAFMAKGESVRLTGFEETDTAKVNSGGGNCETQVISVKEGEKFPDGKRCLKVTLGGINDKKGGGIVIPIPRDKIPEGAKKISVWLKGNEDNAFGPVVLLDGEWCWMGKRYEKKAQINLEDNEWVRLEFKLDDFVPALSRKPKTAREFKAHKYIIIGLGEAKDYSNESITFYIDKIEIY